jgi:hypothetical protein
MEPREMEARNSFGITALIYDKWKYGSRMEKL